MRVVFSDAALADLDAIADWIGQDSWEQSEAFVLAVRERCLSLASHPNRFPAVHIPPFGGLRKLVHRGYLIIYQVSPNQVEIIHVFEGSRDWEAVLLHDVKPNDPG
jgi:toxin ParE1/3/4